VSDEAPATWLIEVSDGYLTATALDRRRPILNFKAVGADIFASAHPDLQARVRFDRDGKGRVIRFTISSPRVYALKFQRSVADFL
jgi:hypothetical protein